MVSSTNCTSSTSDSIFCHLTLSPWGSTRASHYTAPPPLLFQSHGPLALTSPLVRTKSPAARNTLVPSLKVTDGGRCLLGGGPRG